MKCGKRKRYNLIKWISGVFFLAFFNCFFSCKSVPSEPEKEIKLSREILGTGKLNAGQLADFFLMNNQQVEKEFILRFAEYYIQEAAMENINSDVAFAQMCLETGFLRFGGLVQADFHNYCGLGAMDAEHPGERFETEQLGVRAHIQHLQAYATTQEVQLNNPLIDPRYNWVHKTKLVTDIFGLTGTWATDTNYGNKIDEILSRMEKINDIGLK
ncbi:MAG: glucosaminidase domain-containing protein [Treponema sp.]|nr:glucosaminidase domain-containing protein [Treponema sp.]